MDGYGLSDPQAQLKTTTFRASIVQSGYPAMGNAVFASESL